MVKFKDRVTTCFYGSIALFLLSSVVFGMGLLIKNSKESQAKKNYERARIFYREIESEIRKKAGSVIASNNISSIVYSTILRITMNLPYSEVSKYKYQNNGILEIEISGEDDMAMIERLIRYGEVIKKDGKYLIRLF